MTTKKTDSIWDDIAELVLNFMKNHWWKLGLVLLLAGMALSSFKFKAGPVEIEKGQVPLMKAVKK